MWSFALSCVVRRVVFICASLGVLLAFACALVVCCVNFRARRVRDTRATHVRHMCDSGAAHARHVRDTCATQVRPMCDPCATTMRHTCDPCATHVRPPCDIRATHVRPMCDHHATTMRHTCDTGAAQVRRMHDLVCQSWPTTILLGVFFLSCDFFGFTKFVDRHNSHVHVSARNVLC